MTLKPRTPLIRIKDTLEYMAEILSLGYKNGMTREELEEFCQLIGNLLTGKEFKK